MWGFITKKGKQMITAIGKVGQQFVKKLYQGKTFAGKKTKETVQYLTNKNMPKAARAVDIAGTKVNKGIKFADKKIRKYPRTASAIGGAVAFDMIDND